MTTVLDTIEGGTRYLEKRGIEDARRNMQWLVAEALGCSRMELYMRFDRPLEEAVLAPLRERLRQRGEGVPLQHVLGHVWFHGRQFACDRRALVPRPETEELAGLILSREKMSGARVLDMGCGSGVLGLTLAAECPDWQLVLADVSPDALSLARENHQQLGLQTVDLIESDLFHAVTGDFDGIVANLPYVPDAEKPDLAREVSHDPDLALFGGADGLDVIRRFVPQAHARLHRDGWIALEIGHHQASQVAGFLHDAGFQAVEVLRDLSGIERFPYARKA